MLAILIMPVSITIYCIYAWYIAGIRVDKVAADDTTGQLIVLGLMGFTILFMLSMRLYTKVDSEGIHFKYIPFIWQWRKYSWYDIASCEIKTFDPLSDFGGWGIKKSWKGKPANWSYTVKGDRGIYIALKNGKTLIIGTQKGDEALEHIQKFVKPNKHES